MEATRKSKLAAVESQILQANTYLDEHPRAAVDTALKAVNKKILKLKLDSWVTIKAVDGQRKAEMDIDESQRREEAKLDGCYVLKTDLTAAQITKEDVHARYKDLAHVEQAFRTSKTVELEMRPIHVRTEKSTRGHTLVIMLAYRLIKELLRCWEGLTRIFHTGDDLEMNW